MGQNSSQLESTQANDAVSAEGAGHETPAVPLESPHNMEAPSIAKKHPRSPGSQDEEAFRVKKLKTSHEHSQKKRSSVARSVPQHRRGTAIMPRQDPTRDHREPMAQIEDELAPPRPQSSSSSEREFFDASSVVLSNTPRNPDRTRQDIGDNRMGFKQPKQAETLRLDPIETGVQMNIDDDDYDDDQGYVEIEDIFVSAIGRPGPRRHKKKKKKKKKQQRVEGVQNSDRSIDGNILKDVHTATTSEAAVLSETRDVTPLARKEEANPSKTVSTKAQTQPNQTVPKNKSTAAPLAAKHQQNTRKSSRRSKEHQKEKDAKTHDREEAARYAIVDQRLKVLQNNLEFEQRAGDMLRAQQSLKDDPARQAAVKEKFFIEWGISVNHVVLPPNWQETAGEQQRETEPVQRSSEARADGAKKKTAKRQRKASTEQRQSKENARANKQPGNQPTHMTEPNATPSVPPARAVPAGRIPTPTSLEKPNLDNNDVVQAAPEAENIVLDGGDDYEPTYDARVREGNVDPGNKISTWLDHEDTPVPPDEVRPSRGSPEQAQKKLSHAKKRASAHRDDGSDNYHDEMDSDLELEDKAPQAKKTRDSNPTQGKKRQSNSTKARPPTKDNQRGAVSGAWSEEEKARADAVFEGYLERIGRNKNSEFTLRIAFIDGKDAFPEVFKEAIYAAFPLRTKSSIRDLCRRRFETCWKTGPWTEEEDRMLSKAYVRHAGRWAHIADDLDRPAGACRDRWTNVVQYGGKMEKGPWATDEEENLLEVVESFLTEKNGADKDDAKKENEKALDSAVDWAKVSETLKKVRNPKQCREKWKALKARDANGVDSSLLHMTARSSTDAGGLSRKQSDADRAYSKLGWADVYDALLEIVTAVGTTPSLSTEFTHESTFWAVVATKLPPSDSTFPSKLRRRCYYGAMDKFGIEFKDNSAGIGYRAMLLKDTMLQAKERGELVWKRTMEGRIVKKAAAKVEAPANVPTRTAIQHKHLSEEFIENSDDEPEADANDDAIAGAEMEDDEDEDTEDEGNEDEGEELVDELPISSLNSRFEESPRHHSTPALKPRDFMERCQGLTRALQQRLGTVQEDSD